ncbi:hypothetical protein [Halorubrum cibi]|uniref:Uncharacterized protein n=1 Tax=Halorubrum cibi TaxID=413815 RepID=A0A521F5D2_9EURY|nr:hypothetical protein [Halorubrum cibi]SMO91364.1 hypothetical protein SAMN06264867_1203 [Halorubrum cibi]
MAVSGLWADEPTPGRIAVSLGLALIGFYLAVQMIAADASTFLENWVIAGGFLAFGLGTADAYIESAALDELEEEGAR